MIDTDVEGIISMILLLLFIAVVAGIIFRRIKIPYTIGLFLVGVFATLFSSNVAEIEHLFDFVLSPDIILFLFLPPLVFEAAFHINKRQMSRTFLPIIVLAIPGLIISTIIIGYIVGYATPLPLLYAMLFGALISATDPVSVIGLFKNIGAPLKLTTILEGESMFNDASAIITFGIVLGIIGAGTFDIHTIVYGAEGILWSFIGGVITGIVTGVLIGSLIALSGKNVVVSAVITMVVAYASYLLADRFFHASGIIAVLTAGLIVGWLVSVWLKKSDRERLSEFQDFSAYLSNSLIFLLLGITATNILKGYGSDTGLFILIPAALAAVYVSRAVVVYSLSYLMNLFKGRDYIPLKYRHALFWGGLRGAVAIALALSIREDLPYRDEIVIMTVGAVLFTILVDGITTKSLAGYLGLDRPSNIAVYEYYTGIVYARRDGLRALEDLENRKRVEPQIAEKIRSDYLADIAGAEKGIMDLYKKIRPDTAALNKSLWIRLIMVEGSFYEEIYEKGYISEIVLDEMRFFINLKLDDVSSGIIPPRDIVKPDSPEYRFSIRSANILSGIFGGRRFAKNLKKFALTTEYQKYIALNSAAVQMKDSMEIITSGFDFPPEILAAANDEFDRIAERSMSGIVGMSAKYPELSEDIGDYYIRLSMLIQEEDYYSNMMKKGLIFPNVREELLERVEKERGRLEEHIFSIV